MKQESGGVSPQDTRRRKITILPKCEQLNQKIQAVPKKDKNHAALNKVHTRDYKKHLLQQPTTSKINFILKSAQTKQTHKTSLYTNYYYHEINIICHNKHNTSPHQRKLHKQNILIRPVIKYRPALIKTENKITQTHLN